jgi:hypothetical protein
MAIDWSPSTSASRSFGLVFGAHSPTPADYQKLAGPSPGLFRGNSFGEFNPKQYDATYNPWGKGPDAQAMMEAFNQKLTENSSAALGQYAQLQIKAYGYQYEASPPRPTERVTMGEQEQYAQAKAAPHDRGYTEQAIQKDRTSYRGRGAWEMKKQQARANTVAAAMETPGYVSVAPKALSATESYMLWRYNYRYAQTQQNMGAGYSDKYAFGNYQNMSKSEAQKNATEHVKIGQQTNRKIRASGKTGFNTGAQV